MASRLARALAIGVAAGCLAVAATLPANLEARLPRPLESSGRVPLVSGTELLRACFVVDALLLLWLAWRRRGPSVARAALAGADRVGRAEGVAILLVTVLALALRLHHAGSDLWIDEIVNLEVFRDVPALQAAFAFRIANNHVLNTLLVKAMIALRGETELAVRLPAILMGAATIPALWAVTRRALSPFGAILAALLLAVSYHHVFYSQNARGYAGHLLLGVASAGLLRRCLERGAVRDWLLWAAAALAGLVALLLGFFVLAGHAVVAAARVLRRGHDEPRWRALGRLAPPFLLVGYLGVHVYALAIPDAISSLGVIFHSEALGFRALSRDHAGEWLRAIAAAAGPAGVAGGGVAAAIGFLGLRRAWARDPVVTAALGAPVVLMAAFFGLAGLQVTPRSFIGLLPVAILGAVSILLLVRDAAVARVRWIADRERPIALASVAALAAAASLPLPAYYRHPKQDFRGAIAFVERERRPGERVLAVYLAKIGLRYYGPRVGLEEGRDFFVAESREAAARALGEGGTALAVTTLPRATRLELPALDAFIRGRFEVIATFPGTLGDGGVEVWRAREGERARVGEGASDSTDAP